MALRPIVRKNQQNSLIETLRCLMKLKSGVFIFAVFKNMFKLMIESIATFKPFFEVSFCHVFSLFRVEPALPSELEFARIVEKDAFFF